MSRFGKKLVMVGIWAGVGILLGMQFSGNGGATVSKLLPGWTDLSTTPTSQVTGMQSQPIKNGVTQGGQTYVYVPMVIDLSQVHIRLFLHCLRIAILRQLQIFLRRW